MGSFKVLHEFVFAIYNVMKKPYLDKHKMDNRKKLQPNGASQKREVYSQENNVTTVIFKQKNVSQSELGRYTD